MKFKVRKCDKCDGQGGRYDTTSDTRREPEWYKCPACNGTGKRPTKESREFLKAIKPYLHVSDEYLD